VSCSRDENNILEKLYKIEVREKKYEETNRG